MKHLALLFFLFTVTSLRVFPALADSTTTSNPLPLTVNINTTAPAPQTAPQKTVPDTVSRQLSIDQSAVDYAKTHPDSLYKHSIYLKENQTGTGSGFAWLRYCICVLLLLFVWIYGYQKFTKSALCRDMCFDDNGVLKPYDKCPYSFGRVQLFWWTMIILTCYIYFFAATGVLLPVNATMGILLGFSVTVYAGGRILDNRQIIRNPANTRSQDMGNGKGLLTDIMSDDVGISIHRFQTVVFNIVFGIGFLFYFISCFQGHVYPLAEFSEWQYGLLGISSAAYLGLKANENDPTVAPQGAPTVAANTTSSNVPASMTTTNTNTTNTSATSTTTSTASTGGDTTDTNTQQPA